MEYTIGYLIGLLIWGLAGYFTAKKVKEINKGLDVNPILYGVGSFCIGYLWCMIFLAYRVYKFKKSN